MRKSVRPTAQQPRAMTWFRFSSYEIRRGSICPAPDARLEPYDAWRPYQLARAGRRERPAPYQSLLKLLKRARTDLSGTPTAETQDAICVWCSEHGLLGVLMASLPVEVLPDDECIGEVSGGKSHDPRARWRWGPIDTACARFFLERDQPKAARVSYPVPFAEEFWSNYREPLTDFLAAGMKFLAGVEEIRDHLGGQASEKQREHKGPLVLDALQSIARQHTVIAGPRRFEHPWILPFLHAGFAAMALADTRDGRVAHDCAECGTPFFSGAYQARFCDTTCRKTNVMRAYRQRHR